MSLVGSTRIKLLERGQVDNSSSLYPEKAALGTSVVFFSFGSLIFSCL